MFVGASGAAESEPAVLLNEILQELVTTVVEAEVRVSLLGEGIEEGTSEKMEGSGSEGRRSSFSFFCPQIPPAHVELRMFLSLAKSAASAKKSPLLTLRHTS